MPAGRPSTYDRAITDVICDRMAKGESLRSICRDDGMPAESSVRTWMVQDLDGFAARYAHAREAQMEALAEDIVEIADDGSNDTAIDSEGNERVNTEHINRSRLRVDTRKWIMARIAPKRYGDKVEVGGSGPNGAININITASDTKL